MKRTFPNIYKSEPDTTLNIDIANLEKQMGSNIQLNCPFTISEVKKHIKVLKNNKSSSADLIIKKMLKNGSAILLPAFCKVFSIVFESGLFPNEWNKSYQVHIYKSDNVLDCNNYRGIAISSCLGIFFTNILQTRLLSYVDIDDNKLSDNQAAFRKGRSTMDHIFTIKSTVNRYLRLLKKNLYCCFFDFSKAFDSVWRE